MDEGPVSRNSKLITFFKQFYTTNIANYYLVNSLLVFNFEENSSYKNKTCMRSELLMESDAISIKETN